MIFDRAALIVAALLLASAIAAAGVQTWRLVGAKADLTNLELAVEKMRGEAADALARATAEYRTEERRRVAAQMEIDRETASQNEATRVAHRGNRATGDGLRDPAASIAARCAAAARDPSSSIIGPPTPDPAVVLADVLGRAIEEAVDMAELADRRGIAGSACVRSYDSLMKGVK